MYSLSGYGKMISDRHRMAAYQQAMDAVIEPGMTVLDIGTGTGIHALIACQLGAKHVWAIEPDPIIHLAKQIAQENGYGDRITFRQKLSTEVELPEPVDVIISDLRGVLPLLQNHIPTIIDARARFLEPNGMLIPQRDRLFVTLVNAPELYAKHIQPWQCSSLSFDFSAAQPYTLNRWTKCELKPEHCVVSAQEWITLDYATITSPNVQQTITWDITHPYVIHGLGMWFDAILHQEIQMSNAPEAPQLLYGQGFFPLLEPVELRRGDRVTLKLRAHLMQGSYIWQWNTEIMRQQQTIKHFKQSTFAGQLRDRFSIIPD